MSGVNAHAIFQAAPELQAPIEASVTYERQRYWVTPMPCKLLVRFKTAKAACAWSLDLTQLEASYIRDHQVTAVLSPSFQVSNFRVSAKFCAWLWASLNALVFLKSAPSKAHFHK